MYHRFRTFLLTSCLFLTPSFACSADGDWPRWRGPLQNGHSTESNVPVKWDAESVVWKTPLKGRGQSSPVIWGKRIFLTTALNKGKQRIVFCIDRTNGKMLWEHVAWKGVPERSHVMNGWASPSCTTDGERVYAFFGKGGLHCYSVEGKPLWSHDYGDFTGPWGTGASPVLIGDMLIQNCDSTGDAFLIALDKKTGKTIWKTPRDKLPKGGWSTPILVKTKTRAELALNGERGVQAYDPKTGKPLWFCKSFRGRGEPTVTPGQDDLLFVVSGQPGDMYAVRTGGTGNVTKTHMVWHSPRRGGRDQPSPIVIGDHVIVVNMKGVATCYVGRSGKLLWTERLQGAFSSSPIAAGGRAYFQNETGETYVIEPGPKLNIVATNSLDAQDEMFRASLTPSLGQVFSRSDRFLYCIDPKNAQ